jgi:hypothetical protein
MAMSVKRATYVVSFPAHEVTKGKLTYAVPAREQRLFAPDKKDAVERVVRQAHGLANVPPYRSLLRQTAELAKVKTELIETAR